MTLSKRSGASMRSKIGAASMIFKRLRRASSVGDVFGLAGGAVISLLVWTGVIRLDLDDGRPGRPGLGAALVAQALMLLGVGGADLLDRLATVGDGQQFIGAGSAEIALSLDDFFPVLRPRLLDGGDVLADRALIFVNLALGVFELGDQRVDGVAVFGHARRKGFAAHDTLCRDASQARCAPTVTPMRLSLRRTVVGPVPSARSLLPVRCDMPAAEHHSGNFKT